MSGLRRIAWDWGRYDKFLTERFSEESRSAIWRAMDEEVVMAREGRRSEGLGINTLTPEEQVIARELSAHAIKTRMDMMERGMVKDDGLGPWYVPRLFRNIQRGEPISIGPEAHIREKTGTMKQRKYLTAEESEAAARKKFGEKAEIVRDIRTLPMVLARQQRAIAAHDFIEGVRKFGVDIGDPQVVSGPMPKEGKWFTIPQSDLYDWKFSSKDDVTFAMQVPLHIKAEWSGPIQAILDSKFNAWDRVILETKNRPMTLIMNSPFIHDSVIFSKALAANPGLVVSFRFLRMGPKLLADQKFMTDMLNSGMVLWGKRGGFTQEITGMMEGIQLEPGRSLTAKITGGALDIFSEKAGKSAREIIDKAGMFVHDKLLGEQVQKLQVAIAYDFRETLRKKFPDMPEEALNVLAAHEANRFGGSLPPEAMSAFSRGFLNAMFFSRQFTFGNIGIAKDALRGPPEYVMAQIRDMVGPEGQSKAEALKKFAQRHAAAVVLTDVAMYYGLNALLQSAVNVASGTPMPDEVAGYWWRLKQAVNRIAEHPLTPTSYLSFLPSMSPTYYHEPGKEGKILLGYRNDGTGIYGRSVIGRMGEDYTGLLINPAMWTLTKMAPMPRAFLEVLFNSDEFGHPLHGGKYMIQNGTVMWSMMQIAKHMIEAEMPMQQINGAANLFSGHGDYKDAISTFGPYAPPPATVTASQGYPGGPKAGLVSDVKRNMRTQQDLAMADIKRMVTEQNDTAGARQRMHDLGIKPFLQNYLIRGWRTPGVNQNNSRSMAYFRQHASPFELEIMDSMMGRH
jgi:hypothetical protein